MFDSLEEATEINSTCAFCHKSKFIAVLENGFYYLVRCDMEVCDMHCEWNHSDEAVTFQYSLGDKDTVSIVSGW